jgi:integrase
VFPRRDGRAWNDTDYRNWRRRLFAPTAKAAGLGAIRPYDLRHAFVSLLLAEGKSVVDVAAQAGHAPTMTLDTYGHVMGELEGVERRSAEQVIYDEREAAVRTLFARVAETASDDKAEAKKTLR